MERPAGDGPVDAAYLETAVRAWAIQDSAVDEDGVPVKQKRGKPPGRYPRNWLIFDTETTTDMTQRLLFGCWRLCATDETDPTRPRLQCVEEGVFYPDDLDEWEPNAHKVLERLNKEQPKVAELYSSEISNPRLVVMGLREFLDKRLWRAAGKLRAGMVCFNSPFDLSRLASHAGVARSGKAASSGGRYDSYAGGFSLQMWPLISGDGTIKENYHRPRIAIKAIDSKRALKGFRNTGERDEIDQVPGDGQTQPEKDFRWRGEFLDLRTLTFALTDRGHSLESACEAFDVPYTKRKVEHGVVTREYVEYCREDVLATQHLCEATLADFMRHPVELPATGAFSPATIGRSYLKKMGVRAPRTRQIVGSAVSRVVDERLLRWPHRMSRPPHTGPRRLLRLPVDVPDGLHPDGGLEPTHRTPGRNQRHDRRNTVADRRVDA